MTKVGASPPYWRIFLDFLPSGTPLHLAYTDLFGRVLVPGIYIVQTQVTRGILPAYGLGNESEDVCGRVKTKSLPLCALRLGVFVARQSGLNGRQVDAHLRRLDLAVLTETSAPFIHIRRGKYPLAGLNVVEIIIGSQVTEECLQILANHGIVGTVTVLGKDFAVDVNLTPFGR